MIYCKSHGSLGKELINAPKVQLAYQDTSILRVHNNSVWTQLYALATFF